MVVVHTGAAVDGEAIMLTSSGTHFGGSVVEGQPAWKSWVMHVDAAGADFAVGDDFQDFR